MWSFIKKTYLWIIAVPLLAILLGAGLNQAVFFSNHGKFPVQLNSEFQEANGLKPGDVLDRRGHSVMASGDHLKFLADVINFGDGIYSIGDEFLDFGRFSWTFAPYVWGFALIRKIKD